MDWLRGDHRWIGVVALVLLVAVLIWLATRKPRATTTSANPNPSYITNEMWWLWEQLQALEPSSKLGGVYANKPGYHNCRRNLPSYDYSVCDSVDQLGPADKAGAIDWTFPNAQAGDYSTISLYTKRLLASAQDPNDPRLNGWREFYGQADWDSAVEGWDCRYGYAVTSDSSHLWHIHLSETRQFLADKANKEALLSVLKGETVDQWLRKVLGDGAVLLQCPYDKTRQDLLYVTPNGSVAHRWGKGINEFWSGKGASENLGGTIAAGTLTAMWKEDQSGMYIAGLGSGDAGCPPGAGQMWGMELGKTGTRSGWGSFEKCYGAYPSALPSVITGTEAKKNGVLIVALLVLAMLLGIVADVLALTT